MWWECRPPAEADFIRFQADAGSTKHKERHLPCTCRVRHLSYTAGRENVKRSHSSRFCVLKGKRMAFFQSCVALYAIVISILAVCFVSCLFMLKSFAYRDLFLSISKIVVMLGGSAFAYATVSVLGEYESMNEVTFIAKMALPYHVLLLLFLLS